MTCLTAIAGCNRYSDFTLPAQPAPLGVVTWSWESHPAPVLERGQWVDALNPSVAKFQGRYLNTYSAYDGRSWHTLAATSNDGLQWSGHRKIISPAGWEGDYIAANGTVLQRNGQLHYWYQGGRTPKIGLATSKDGGTWTKHPKPILELGPRGSWDERGVADPYVIEVDGQLYMYYLGQDRARRQRLGVAQSSDGLHWQKLRSNPILELGEPITFDEIGLGEPAVWRSHGWYWMLYTGRDRREYRRLGLAKSKDGVHWQRVTNQPVFKGDLPWNSKVVCDPHVEVQGDTILMWYGGGDAAQPAENLHGQIGFAKLKLRIATLAK